jgi:hypothetical protein
MARSRELPCPEADQHTPAPEGYLAFDEWAERMSKTHRQVQCPGCGRWQIWVPRSSTGDGVT